MTKSVWTDMFPELRTAAQAETAIPPEKKAYVWQETWKSARATYIATYTEKQAACQANGNSAGVAYYQNEIDKVEKIR